MLNFVERILGLINQLILLPSEIKERKSCLNSDLEEEKEFISSDEYDDFIV
ncbi:hypothetical protein WL555_07175 [Staphylococcus warneri]|uniref:hypothetical protein n=1 Tax=Staphylococcus TaxID=1279 RepID=UPI000A516796|nr:MULTISPECIES: hypothetical protein [Staphylococcus]MBJ7888596.1 hypothetical protein [Bacillaceae bacterium HSR45]MCG7305744.1 hypothetical protein [Staphylococcus warneri]MCM3482927.1 hypothetical protein [Staphylococcus warneri]MCR4501186.1 hypothetical protein [Staphylococcus warneri]MCT1632836.1 hypothetical protein [Staphylococcus warneri]